AAGGAGRRAPPASPAAGAGRWGRGGVRARRVPGRRRATGAGPPPQKAGGPDLAVRATGCDEPSEGLLLVGVAAFEFGAVGVLTFLQDLQATLLARVRGLVEGDGLVLGVGLEPATRRRASRTTERVELLRHHRALVLERDRVAVLVL